MESAIHLESFAGAFLVATALASGWALVVLARRRGALAAAWGLIASLL